MSMSAATKISSTSNLSPYEDAVIRLPTEAETKEDAAVREAADAIFNPKRPLNHITDMLKIHNSHTGGSTGTIRISFDFTKISEMIKKLQELSMKTFGHVHGFDSRIQAIANLEINATYSHGYGSHSTLKLRLITDLTRIKAIHEGTDESAKEKQRVSADIFMPMIQTLNAANVHLLDNDFGIINIYANNHITSTSTYRIASR